MERSMVKKKGRARERQRKGQPQGEGAHVETWKSQVVPGASEHPPPCPRWGLSPGHTHTQTHTHTDTHTHRHTHTDTHRHTHTHTGSQSPTGLMTKHRMVRNMT